MLASHCIVFIFLFWRSFFSLCTSCSRCWQVFIALFHSGVLVFLFFSVHFSQQLMLTFLYILSILLFLISFFLVHTWCIFLLLAFRCIRFDNQLLFFNGYISISMHSILHIAMSIFSPSTCFSKIHSFISYFNSFVVWLWRFSFLCIFVMIFFLYFFYLPLVLRHHGISHIAIVSIFFIAPNVCTYFCLFLFPLLAFPLFQVFFVMLKFLLLFHVCKCFFLCFLFVDFSCRFLYITILNFIFYLQTM
jgi:hypothetical protein